MAGFMSSKTKRKDLEEVYDEFSDFSLNSPARKIRRLDAELPPIMEEEDPAVPLSFEQHMSREVVGSEMVDLEPLPLNERALVMYKPVNNPLIMSPSSSNVSFRVTSDLISGFKNQAFWHENRNAVTVEELLMDDKRAVANNSLAVVPWVPSQFPPAPDSESREVHVEEPMEAEATAGGTSMEVEESVQQAGGSAVGEGYHQWQQHCMIPQPPTTNTSAPIMWSWG